MRMLDETEDGTLYKMEWIIFINYITNLIY